VKKSHKHPGGQGVAGSNPAIPTNLSPHIAIVHLTRLTLMRVETRSSCLEPIQLSISAVNCYGRSALILMHSTCLSAENLVFVAHRADHLQTVGEIVLRLRDPQPRL
jgi:hypothetical protein